MIKLKLETIEINEKQSFMIYLYFRYSFTEFLASKILYELRMLHIFAINEILRQHLKDVHHIYQRRLISLELNELVEIKELIVSL